MFNNKLIGGYVFLLLTIWMLCIVFSATQPWLCVLALFGASVDGFNAFRYFKLWYDIKIKKARGF